MGTSARWWHNGYGLETQSAGKPVQRTSQTPGGSAHSRQACHGYKQRVNMLLQCTAKSIYSSILAGWPGVAREKYVHPGIPSQKSALPIAPPSCPPPLAAPRWTDKQTNKQTNGQTFLVICIDVIQFICILESQVVECSMGSFYTQRF